MSNEAGNYLNTLSKVYVLFHKNEVEGNILDIMKDITTIELIKHIGSRYSGHKTIHIK